jgi:sugar/nucleoside kinase (ribokinase family)
MPPADRVLVFGDLIDDVIVVPRGPIRSDTDTPSDIRSRAGGSAANTAAWLARTGADVTFAGRCAQADVARHAALLGAAGVDARITGDPHLPTGTIIVLVDGDVRSMLTERGANAALSPADIGVEGFSLVHATGYSLIGHAEAFRVLVDRVHASGGRVSLNAGAVAAIEEVGVEAFRSVTAGVDILIATTAEAIALTGAASPEAAASALSHRHAVVAVTAGREGAWVAVDGAAQRVDAIRVDAVDPTGAGDAFTSGLLAGLIDGEPAAAAATRGVELAARAVTVVGGRPPTG